jgi:hypothetical protein
MTSQAILYLFILNETVAKKKKKEIGQAKTCSWMNYNFFPRSAGALKKGIYRYTNRTGSPSLKCGNRCLSLPRVQRKSPHHVLDRVFK